MPFKNKYKDGDIIGPYDILLIHRTYKEKNNIWHGNFKCPFCGKTFDARISEVAKGRRVSDGCDKSKDKQKKAASENGKRNKKDLVGKKFGLLTVIKDTGKRKKSGNGTSIIWLCQCSCENQTLIEVAGRHLVSGDTSSCGCIKQSSGEKIIEEILKELNIVYIKNKTFSDCINPDTQRHLHYDFFLPDYNCCIEFDGIQHFKERGWNTKSNLERNRIWDNLKNNYCKNNHIRLIRISYKEKTKLNADYLLQLIQ